MPFFPPLCFLQWNQSINNMHNFSTSIFNGAAKALLSYRSHSVPVWCLLLWNSPQMQTVLRGLLVCVCGCVCACTCVCMCLLGCEHNEECLCSVLLFYFRESLFLFACLWVFPYITERGASEPSHTARNDPHPQIAYSRSISGEGKIWGWIFNDENKWGNTGTQLGGSHGYVSSLDEQHDGLFTPGGGKALPQEMAH